ncbi:MAG: outer membrane lipoprotein-sorting protein [Spirochaetaceae bacterium]|nr:outer membrane lipoprotein-sorting protein [Spirochaetaceae bacterium]
MKKLLPILLLLSSFSVYYANAQNAGQVNATDDLSLLKKADSLASYYDSDFSAVYAIVQSKPGQKNTAIVAAVFRRDAEDMYLILVMKPDINRGQGYLKQGKTLWFYDPESKRFNSTSSAGRFQNTNARNSDFTRSTLSEDYNIISAENETLGKFSCRVLSLQAKTNDMSFPRMKIWISLDGLVRKVEDYSLSGELMRTQAIDDYHFVDNHYVPKRILIIDNNKGAWVNNKFINERTQITISQPAFNKLDSSIYSKTYLENQSR